METAPLQTTVVPKVSVIFIARNQYAELRRAIAALERSSERESFEILVVDRASSDQTPDIDQEFPAVTVLRLPHDFGATKAMNIATRTAKGEFLFFLAPQAEVAPDTISKLVAHLESDSSLAAVCPLLCDDTGAPIPQIQMLPDRAYLSHAAYNSEPARAIPDTGKETVENPYPGRAALMVRKYFVAGMNYFDERFGQYWADADLAIRIRHAQKQIRLYPSIPIKLHKATETEPDDTAHRADRISGAALLLEKHYGFLGGLGFRIGAILKALASFDIGLFFALISGVKIDGTHAG